MFDKVLLKQRFCMTKNVGISFMNYGKFWIFQIPCYDLVKHIFIMSYKLLVVHHWVHRSSIALYAVASERKDSAAEWDYLRLWLEVVMGLSSSIS